MNISKSYLLTITTFAFAAFAALLPGETYAAAGDIYQMNPTFKSIYKYTPAGGTPTTFSNDLQNTPNHIAFDKAGNIYVSESSPAFISKFTPAGAKSTFATGIDAQGLECDAAGNLFVSDSLSHSIIKITPAGVKSTFASAMNTLDLAFDPKGNLYALDYGADPSNPSGPGINGQGKVYYFAPDGTKNFYKSPIDRPKRIAIDAAGSTYIASSDGVLHVTSFYYSPDGSFGGSTILATTLGNIQGLACDSFGNLYVSTPSGTLKFDHKTHGRSTFSSVTNGAGLAVEPPRAVALNIATRLGVQDGENVLIAGFIISGGSGKSVVIRGIGPSLAKFGIQGALQDPVLELHYPSGTVLTNDNWKDTRPDAIQATGLAPTDDRESAFTYNLPPGSYTVVMKGKNNTTGIGLVEVYDIDQTSFSDLANLSTRGFVGSGDNVMIGGFIVGGGNGAARVMIRAIGPSLAAAGISNPLQNPTLTLRDGNGALLNSNNDWLDDNGTEIYETGIAPNNTAESAIVMTLPAGHYTAVLAGANGGTGVGLVEFYHLQ